MVKVKLRGIYSTALTKLLLDHGFEIVQPSVNNQKRFGLQQKNLPSDLNIYDRLDRQGIQAIGKAEAIDALSSILKESLFDLVVRRPIAGQINLPLIDVEFPWLSKRKLDACRKSITPTVKAHHYYKACGAKISSFVDMAEKLIAMGNPIKEVEELLNNMIRDNYSFDESEIKMEHVKLNGSIVNLGSASVLSYDGSKRLIKLCRIIKGRGMYDGLEIPRESGDYAITEAKIGDWYLKTRYYSCNDYYKGTYININTPIELYPNSIRYVDLEVDLCIKPKGNVQILDEDKFEAAVREGIVSKKLSNAVDKIVERILIVHS